MLSQWFQRTRVQEDSQMVWCLGFRSLSDPPDVRTCPVWRGGSQTYSQSRVLHPIQAPDLLSLPCVWGWVFAEQAWLPAGMTARPDAPSDLPMYNRLSNGHQSPNNLSLENSSSSRDPAEGSCGGPASGCQGKIPVCVV